MMKCTNPACEMCRRKEKLKKRSKSSLEEDEEYNKRKEKFLLKNKLDTWISLIKEKTFQLQVLSPYDIDQIKEILQLDSCERNKIISANLAIQNLRNLIL